MAGIFYPVNPSSKLGTVNNITITTSASTPSAAFGSQTYQIRIACPVAVNYKVDSAPTAAATDALLPANWVEYVKVTPGQKVAVFATSTGTVSIVEITN